MPCQRNSEKAVLLLSARPRYIRRMLWRVRNSRGRPINAPAAFIHPCQPIVAKQPPSGPGWVHELKHDGYRQISKKETSQIILVAKSGSSTDGPPMIH
jgi:ATP-dependent DNA ligase